MLKAIGVNTHQKFVFQRRVQQLSSQLAPLFAQASQILDVGCGDGLIDKLILEKRPDLNIHGVDIFKRPHTHIPVTTFDGQRLPFADKSFDSLMFIDVLHHTQNPHALLKEACRVAKTSLIIKDHCRDGLFANATLKLMDYVGNAPYGVVLEYNYLSRAQRQEIFKELELTVKSYQNRLSLYPFPASALFDRRLHFIAQLQIDVIDVAA